MSSGDSQKNGAHVLIFPFPAQGHILPMLDFTHQLATRGLTITILVTPKNVPILDPLLSCHPSIQTLIFPFPDHPSVPPGVENVKDIGNQGNSPIIAALSKLHDPILQWFKSHTNPPVAFISDFFLGWTQDLAHQIGIPRVVFYSSGAFSTAVMVNLWVNFDSITAPTSAVEFPDLPRSPSFIWEHLPSVFRRTRENFSGSSPDSVADVVRNGMVANSSSWGAVFNTFEELETEYLDWWRKKMGHVYAVGPLNLIGVPDSMGRGNLNSSSNDGGVLGWLDGCPDGSVLYVCFGSQKILKKAQMEALAIGLEESGVRFIWVAKPVTAQQLKDGYGSVPDGFEDRVSGRGVVVKGWAPQVPILNHSAVGGFLSHFGMNSMLEAIVAGVVILGWPMEADQFIDEKLLVDYIGAAVGVCQGPDTVPDPVALAQTIKQAMRKDIVEKERAKELRNKALGAVQIGGSSMKDLDGFVRELAQLN